jgi:predicted AlkP superfamily pyrophosphatase or phosphodiesterase
VTRQTIGCVVLAAAIGFAVTGPRAPNAQTATPATKLLVTVVVDQLRFDYLTRYNRHWAAGLKRLLSEGAVFERAMYPYLNTVTCAGHATIGTGALPYRHGIILNEWYRRDAGRRMACTDDETVRSVSYSPPAEPVGHSARRLRVPTLGDRLRAASPASRVVSLSMKPRSAAMMAGHGGTAVTWFADSNVWGTSTAFAQGPVPEVKAFIDADPVERDRHVVWTHLRDVSDYVGSDASPHERSRPGWTSEFPHPLAGAPGSSEARFFDLWERSPFSDAYLGRMAAALIRAYKLGQGSAVDHLAISFSALDYVGHDFGPDSHEVQDTLLRLDATIGDLLAVLDREVGRDRYIVGVSADHGVSRIPEALAAEGEQAGRVLNAQVLKVAEAAMVAAHGPGPHVIHVEYTNVYLSPRARERARKDASFVTPLIEAVTKIPGVDRAFAAALLPTRRDSSDPIERAAALSFHPDESGDVMVLLKPNWIGTNTSAATHGSPQWYDQHVPVIFLGGPVKPGRYSSAASPADLAPTLAATIKLLMSDVDGRVLSKALR